MPPYEYDWTRAWQPAREVALDGVAPGGVRPGEGKEPLDEVDWDARFGDEGGEPARAADPDDGVGGYDHPLAEHNAVGLLVLVGAAGAGKTHELVRLEEALKAGEFVELVRVREAGDGYVLAERLLSPRVRGALDDGRVVHLLVDALDESADPGVLDRLVSQLRELGPTERSRVRLRVTCRSSYYAASLGLRAHLAEIEGLLGSARTLEIQPLTREQIASAAATRGIPDPEAFVARVWERRVMPLAEVPGSLGLLLDLYDEEGDFPGTRMEVYERGINLHLRLTSRGKDNALAWTPEQVMDGVGAVAALLLLSGKTFVQADPATHVSPNVAVPLHEVRQLRPLRFLPERDLARFFDTGLFEGAILGPSLAGLVEIRSREFAEFLAARHLALPAEGEARPPSREDLLALLAVAEDPRRGVRPSLFGVAGWAAAFNPDALFDHLLDTDADALLQGDPGAHDEERRRLHVERLDALVSARRLSPYDLRRLGLEGLRHSGVGDQIERLLQRGDAADALPTVLGLALYAATRAEELTPQVVAIAFNVGLPLHVRRVALDALREAAPERGHLLVLLPLLSDDEGDPFFSLRADAAGALYPRVVSAGELFAAMTFPAPGGAADPKVDFSFQYYLTYELPPQLDAEGVGAAFEATALLIHGRKGHWDIGRTVEAFEDALLTRAAELSGLTGSEGPALEVVGFSDHLLAWMRRNAYTQRGAFARAWRSSNALRALGLALAAEEGEDAIRWSHLFWSDRDWIAELLPASTGRERAFYIELLWSVTHNLEGVPVRLRVLSDDGFRAYAAAQFDLPHESSEEVVADALRRWAGAWHRHDSESDDVDEGPEDDAGKPRGLDPNGIIGEAEGWGEVWDGLYRERLYRSNGDWTAFPNWSDLSERHQVKALDLAYAFLSEGGPGEGWSGRWREARRHGEVNAAHAALRLLSDHGRIPDRARWLPTLVALTLVSGSSEERWRAYALASWDLDPSSAREAAIHTALEPGGEGRTNREALVAFAEHDTALVQAMGESLATDDLKPEAAALITAVLIEADYEAGAGPIGALLERSTDPQRVAAVAVPLLQSDANHPALWSRLEWDAQAGAGLVARLATGQFRHDDAPINVTSEQRCALLDHAVTRFPPSTLPKRPLSGGFSPTTVDHVQAWVGQQASLLIDEGEYEVLESFVERHPRYGYLAHRAWISWRAKKASESPWATAELIALLNDLRLRRVATPHELQRVVLEALARYQRWLDDGAVYDLWNEVRPALLRLPATEGRRRLPDVLVPKREEPVSDHLARFLNMDLARVAVRREVRTPKRGSMDVEVTVLDSAGGKVQTIVEVKGSYHSAATDIQAELVDRYLTRNEATGVHLVYDFWTPSWSKLDARRRQAEKMTGAVLERTLEEALRAKGEGGRVAVLVIRAPFPN